MSDAHAGEYRFGKGRQFSDGVSLVSTTLSRRLSPTRSPPRLSFSFALIRHFLPALSLPCHVPPKARRGDETTTAEIENERGRAGRMEKWAESEEGDRCSSLSRRAGSRRVSLRGSGLPSFDGRYVIVFYFFGILL